MSFATITPSAARGILESVLWKPAIKWHIDRIAVLSPIEFVSFRRNEVNSRAATPSLATVSNGGLHTQFFADQDRAQRNTVALRNVDYKIDAHFSMTERAGPDDNATKFVEMFRRRLANGQHWQQSYLGCREFIADVSPIDADCPSPIDVSRDLGIMLWDIIYLGGTNRPVFFAAQMVNGVVEVPRSPDAAIGTLGRQARSKGSE
jgi:CRISPR-associated protein Cas5d